MINSMEVAIIISIPVFCSKSFKGNCLRLKICFAVILSDSPSPNAMPKNKIIKQQ